MIVETYFFALIFLQTLYGIKQYYKYFIKGIWCGLGPNDRQKSYLILWAAELKNALTLKLKRIYVLKFQINWLI